MKQTFKIPEGCTRVTIEQQCNQIITTFEPEVVFEDGDILCYKDQYIFIFKNKRSEKQANYYYLFVEDVLFDNDWCGFENIRFATESEKQQLFDALAKVGKKWNADKKCIEDLKPERWRSKIYEPYYVLDDFFEVCESEENNDKIDNKRYNAGNYFQTEQQAQDFAEQIKKIPR